MTRDDIIRMAQQTGWDFGYEMCVEHVCEFAALVAAAEREACVKVVELVAREIDDTNGTATYIAKAIRARGESK
jgi:hypothetical protein